MRQEQAPHLKPPLPSPLVRCQALLQGGGSPLKVMVWERVCMFGMLAGASVSLLAATVVRTVLTWCLRSLKSGPCAGFTVPRVQNKHVSSTHPETKSNLHHVSEYPLGLLIESYSALSTASRSLHSPDRALKQTSQEGERFISQGNLLVLNKRINEINIPSRHTNFRWLWDRLILFGFISKAAQTKEILDAFAVALTVSGSVWVERDISILRDAHSLLIKMHCHRQRESLGRIRSDWDWCRWELGRLPWKATHERI